MKKLILLFSFICLVGSQALAVENADVFTSGEDWRTKMNEREKLMAILLPINFFERFGVPFESMAPEYLPKVDKFLEENPYLEQEDVLNIFASTVYAYEPDSRKPLERLEYELNRYNAAGEKGPVIKIFNPASQESEA